MAVEKTKATNVKVGTTKGKLVRFSHLHVFKAHLNQESKKLEFSVQLWIPKENTEDVAAIRAAIAEQIAAYKAIDGEPGPNFHNPLKDGDKLVDKKGRPKPVPGHWVVSAKTAALDEDGNPNEPPGVVGTERGADDKPKALTSKQIKSGDYGRASINFKFFTKGDSGVGAYLNNLQKVKDGQALGGRVDAADEFADYDDEDGDDPLY